MLRELKERFVNSSCTGENIFVLFTQADELYNQVHHPRKVLLLWSFIHTAPFRLRRNLVKNFLSSGTWNIVHRVGPDRVIYVDVTSIIIVHFLYTLVLLHIIYPETYPIIHNRCVRNIIHLRVSIVLTLFSNVLQQVS